MSENTSAPLPTSKLTVTALVLGGFAALFLFASQGPVSTLFGLVAIGCAVPALRKANKGLAGGRNLAVAGLILGIIGAFGGLGSIPSTPASTTTYASGSSDAATPAPPPATPTVISATQMGDDFESNQIAAEKKWGGLYVQFTSTVTNINSSGVSFGKVTSQFSFTQISCRVKDENSVLSLAKGKPATVRGVVDGDQMLGVITLNDCEIVNSHG